MVFISQGNEQEKKSSYLLYMDGRWYYGSSREKKAKQREAIGRRRAWNKVNKKVRNEPTHASIGIGGKKKETWNQKT